MTFRATTFVLVAALFASAELGSLRAEVILPGDGNLDFSVTTADYTVWANHFGSSGALPSTGDYNGDGLVTTADYTVWANNFGAALSLEDQGGEAGPESVLLPEPGSVAIWGLLGLLAGLVAYRRRSAQPPR